MRIGFALPFVSLQVARSTGETFAKNSDAIFLETSAKDNINVHDLFRTIGEKGFMGGSPGIYASHCRIVRACACIGIFSGILFAKECVFGYQTDSFTNLIAF